MTPRMFRVMKNYNDTADCYTLSLKPEEGDPLLFAPGQFTMLYAFGRGEVRVARREGRVEPARELGRVGRVGRVLVLELRAQPLQDRVVAAGGGRCGGGVGRLRGRRGARGGGNGTRRAECIANGDPRCTPRGNDGSSHRCDDSQGDRADRMREGELERSVPTPVPTIQERVCSQCGDEAGAREWLARTHAHPRLPEYPDIAWAAECSIETRFGDPEEGDLGVCDCVVGRLADGYENDFGEIRDDAERYARDDEDDASLARRCPEYRRHLLPRQRAIDEHADQRGVERRDAGDFCRCHGAEPESHQYDDRHHQGPDRIAERCPEHAAGESLSLIHISEPTRPY